MARGRKKTSDARRKNVVVRFQESEALNIQEVANAQGKAVSAFIRDVVLGSINPKQENV
jgi:hypothetical protein